MSKIRQFDVIVLFSLDCRDRDHQRNAIAPMPIDHSSIDGDGDCDDGAGYPQFAVCGGGGGGFDSYGFGTVWTKEVDCCGAGVQKQIEILCHGG